MRLGLTILFSALAVFVIACLAFWAIVLSGRIDVSADGNHWTLTESALATIRQNAVAREALSVEDATPKLDRAGEPYTGIIAYEDMCASCHIPPGGSPTPLAQGLNPSPPDLAEAAAIRSPEELFWITKHGIRMSGMPAWGATHDDEELWPIIALITRFPDFTDSDYDDLLTSAREAGVEHDHGGHDHASHLGEHENQSDPVPNEQENHTQDHEHQGNHRHADDVEHDTTHEEHDHDH